MLLSGSLCAMPSGAGTQDEALPFFRMNAPSVSVPKADSLEYGVGDRVRHLKYGDGTVTNIVDGPRDYQVTVQFDGPGQKIMYAAFAKLKKI